MLFLVLIVAIVIVIAFFRWLFTGIIPESAFRAAGKAVDWSFRIFFLAMLLGGVGLIVYYNYGPQAALGAVLIPAYLILSRLDDRRHAKR